MYEFHSKKKQYFDWQYEVASKHIIPFITAAFELGPELKVCEVGCGEAGVLKAFIDSNLTGTGIELRPQSVELAKQFLEEDIQKGRVEIINENIYDIDGSKDLDYQFDIIVLKDVIEHIFEQDKFMKHLHKLLKPNGVVFFGFPPWQMPFGGHQQICSNRLLKVLPYFHLLPRVIYKGILGLFKERPNTIKELLELKETGLSIERFKSYVNKADLKVVSQQHFLFNPIYKYKFGLKTRKQFSLINSMPFLRNFVTSCSYFLVTRN